MPEGVRLRWLEGRLQGRDRPRIERIANPWVRDLADDEPGLLEDPQMLGRGRGCEPDLFDEVAADAGRPPQKRLDDLHARRMSERLGNLGYPLMCAAGSPARATCSLTVAIGASYSSIDEIRNSVTHGMNQDRPIWTRLVDGVASAMAFVAAVGVIGALEHLGWTNVLGLALASTMIVAGAVGVLRAPAPFTAHFTRLGDWMQFGADFAAAVVGLWVVASVFPAGRDFLCEPLVPWRVSIAIFGAFAMGCLAQAVVLRAPGERMSLFIFLGFFWIAPFYGFFHAPWMLAQSIASSCADRPPLQSLVAAAGMVVAAEASRRVANWLFAK